MLKLWRDAIKVIKQQIQVSVSFMSICHLINFSVFNDDDHHFCFYRFYYWFHNHKHVMANKYQGILKVKITAITLQVSFSVRQTLQNK